MEHVHQLKLREYRECCEAEGITQKPLAVDTLEVCYQGHGGDDQARQAAGLRGWQEVRHLCQRLWFLLLLDNVAMILFLQQFWMEMKTSELFCQCLGFLLVLDNVAIRVLKSKRLLRGKSLKV